MGARRTRDEENKIEDVMKSVKERRNSRKMEMMEMTVMMMDMEKRVGVRRWRNEQEIDRATNDGRRGRFCPEEGPERRWKVRWRIGGGRRTGGAMKRRKRGN